MVTVLYVEINVIGLAILGIVFANQRGAFGVSRRQKAFNALTISMMGILLLDSGMWVLDGRGFPGARALNCAVTWLYYFFNCLVPSLWLRYAMLFFGISPRTLHRFSPLLTLPLVANTGMLIANIRVDLFYSVNAENVYARGPLFAVAVALGYSYMVAAFALSLYYFRRQSVRARRREYGVMVGILIMPFVGSLIQVLFYGLSLMWITVALSILLIFINFQNRQISTDSLTGLNNRYLFDKYMTGLVDRAQSDAEYALMLLDIDHFKAINDTYGHVVGDKALIATADALKRAVGGARAFLSRYGGDEFAIVCEAEQAADIMRRVRETLTLLNARKSEPFALSVSIGEARFRGGKTEEIDRVIARADQRMYEDKQRNR